MATCTVIGADIPENNSDFNKQELKKITVNFGIFFDGTNNQRLQVATGRIIRNKESGKKKEKIKAEIEKYGGVFDEDTYNRNGVIRYVLTNGSTNTKQIDKLNKKIAEYNDRYGNRLNDKERELIESFSWDKASGEKREGETNIDALRRKSQIRVGMPRNFMCNVDYTNIARLEPLYNYSPTETATGPVYSYRIYVTGSGTFADIDKGSDVTGLSTGQNTAGVVQKVKDALDVIFQKTKIIETNDAIQEVDYKFNVFGFSRGSTEARLFVDFCSAIRGVNRPKVIEDVIQKYMRNTSKDAKWKRIIFPKQKSIEFPFVGIYDTVSSVGVIRPGIWNWGMGKVLRTAERVTPSASDFHDLNKNELGLDSLVYDDNVKQIVHICALDEYRENFALQVLPSNNKVDQFFIPGIHTDIGGGDLDGYTEEKYIPKKNKGRKLYIPQIVTPGKRRSINNGLLEVSLEHLKQLGWIKRGENILMDDIVEENDEIIKLRKYSQRGYTYLPLYIMAEKANNHTCTFPLALLSETYKISKDLQIPSNFNEMGKLWKDSKSPYGHCYYPDNDGYKELRKKLLHFSSSIMKTGKMAIVNGPNLTESDDGDNSVTYYDRFLDYHPHPKGWYGKITESGVKDIVFEEAGNQNDDNYLGEAVVIFESQNERYTIVRTTENTYKFIRKPNLTSEGNKEYYTHSVKNKKRKNDTDPEWIEKKEEIVNIIDGVPASVKIYGKAQNKDEAQKNIGSFVGMTTPSVEGSSTLRSGNYYAYKRQMDTPGRAYRNDAYLIVNNRKDEQNDGLNGNNENFIANMTLRGTLNGREVDMDGIYLHRTNNDGNATISSEGCLTIDGRDWGEVDRLLGQSQNVFIHLNRS